MSSAVAVSLSRAHTEPTVCTPPTPHPPRSFDVLYKQRVGTEDVYLGMSDKGPSTAHCDVMVVRVELPSVKGRGVALADIELDVTADRLRVSTHAHKLSTYLPLKVKHKEGSAAWDGGKCTLTLTLPILRDDIA